MVDIDSEIGAEVVDGSLRVGFVLEQELASLHPLGLFVEADLGDPRVEMPASFGSFPYRLAVQAMVVEIGVGARDKFF